MIFRSPMRYGPRSTLCGRRRRTADCTFTAGGTGAAPAVAGRSLDHVRRAARAIGRRLLSGADRNYVPGAWLHETSVEITGWRALHPGIDPGEASSICLAEQHPKSLLIIDDRAGRLEAKARGVRYIGLLGLIVQARRMGKLDEARPLLDALQQVGYCMSDARMSDCFNRLGNLYIFDDEKTGPISSIPSLYFHHVCCVYSRGSYFCWPRKPIILPYSLAKSF